MTVYVYPDNQWEETLHLVDSTSIYSLTGAMFARDRYTCLCDTAAVMEFIAGQC